MKYLTSDEAFPKWLRGGVVAVGSFDGYHRGHAAVLERARAIAGREERPLIVATFDPHPARLFDPDAGPLNLTTLEQCERLFARAGADVMLVVRSDHNSGRLSAREMVSSWLVDDVGAGVIVTGEHFTFGRDREGDAAWLGRAAAEYGARAEIVPARRDRAGEIISSQRIRRALCDGDCNAATALLSRPFTVEDKVRHGNKLGRTIGFPTANMLLHDYVRPRYGVYAIRGRLPYGRVLDGVANLGIRPMMDLEEEILESHLFDFSGDLYGQVIEIEFIQYIRRELKLNGFDELQEWITKDCKEARLILSEVPHFA